MAGDCKLALSLRKGTDLIQLLYNHGTRAFYIHHRKQGKLVCYDFAGEDEPLAIQAFYKYVREQKP